MALLVGLQTRMLFRFRVSGCGIEPKSQAKLTVQGGTGLVWDPKRQWPSARQRDEELDKNGLAADMLVPIVLQVQSPKPETSQCLAYGTISTLNNQNRAPLKGAIRATVRDL